MLEIPGKLRAGSINMDADVTGGGDSIGNKFSKKFSFVDSVPATDGVDGGSVYTYTITGPGHSFYYAKMTLSGKDGGGTHRTAEIEVFNGELQSLFLSNIDAGDIDVVVYGDTVRVAPLFSQTWFFTNHVEGYTGTLGAGISLLGNRGVIASADPIGNEYFNIGAVSDAVDFGNNSDASTGPGMASTGSRGLEMGGKDGSSNPTDTIGYFTFGTPGNSADFGEVTQTRYLNGNQAVSDGNRALLVGGEISTPTRYDTMDYVTAGTLGFATNFGELSVTASYGAAVSDGNRGVMGGRANPAYDHIDIFTIGTTSDGVDFGGELAGLSYGFGAVSSSSGRAVFGGGYLASPVSYPTTICFFNIAQPGYDASDFNELAESKHYLSGGVSNGHRGCFFGGTGAPAGSTDTIEYITIHSNSEAADFGELQTAGQATGSSGE